MSLFENLVKEVLDNSLCTTDFKEAATEWKLYKVERVKNFQCICGKNPITELCYIFNMNNNKELIVGNECVKKFGINVNWFFEQSRRLEKSLRPNKIMLDYLYGNKIIDLINYRFMLSIINKKKLTKKELNKKDVLIYIINNRLNKK